MTSSSTAADGKFHFAIDRGGTFTDVYCRLPDGTETVSKLLSEDPSHYRDAPTEGIRRILYEYTSSNDGKEQYSRGDDIVVPTHAIGSIRMGTTVATNALLERDGARMALLTTRGLTDTLQIGNQSRPDIFDLSCAKPSVLYEQVVGIAERVVLAQYAPESLATTLPRQEGVTGEHVLVEQAPDLQQVRQQLEQLRDDGIQAIAVCLLHAFLYPQHEVMIGDLAASMECFTHISLSHQVMPMVKLVSRGHTTAAAAYLTPNITTYLSTFCQGFDEHLRTKVPLSFMKSDGGLAPMDAFGGHQAILSGPAGGVVGYAKTTTTASASSRAVIGFDMGGTSTDVSRYDGHSMDHVLETVTAGIAIQAPQLDIHTVAAGGGSRLFLKRGMFLVGPESAGAHPGPVCYRKPGGVLAVTDANVVLGRVVPELFPNMFGPNEDAPLDVEGARAALAEWTQLPEAAGRTVEELAYGFLQVANEAMCRPIRNLTQMKGFDITTHTLACFGGAGPQHACAMAKALGMERVFVHRYGGILSAYGLSMADAVQEEQEPAAEVYDSTMGLSQAGRKCLDRLGAKAKATLVQQGYEEDKVQVERFINMRYEGTDNSIMVRESTDEKFHETFRNCYIREFGFTLEGRDILIDDYRIRAVVLGPTLSTPPEPERRGLPPSTLSTKAYFASGWATVPVYKEADLQPGHEIPGPSIIVQPISTVVLEENCHALVTAAGDIEILVEQENKRASSKSVTADGEQEIKEDPVQLSIFSHRFMGIAEQMGRTLQRTAISVNMKERLDFSCALFTKNGGLVANAPHIPVHLGAMERAVQFQVEYWRDHGGLQEGDVLVSNHPQLAGGSHLPDITVITPVFYEGEIIFFVASRGHHADIGGIAPGSMPPHSRRLEDEGAMIVAFKLVKAGQFQEKGITDILNSPSKLPGNSGTRNLRDNLSDLRAQVAANNSGIRLLQELVAEHGLKYVQAYMRVRRTPTVSGKHITALISRHFVFQFIQANAESSVRKMLKGFAATHGSVVEAEDFMDDGSCIKLTISIDEDSGSAKVSVLARMPRCRTQTSFSSSTLQGPVPRYLPIITRRPRVRDLMNYVCRHLTFPRCTVTYSAVIYSLRCLVAEDIPLNQGCLAPIEFVIPENCLLNPSSGAGVVGGNVLTSQRVVDVVLRAFQACAASQGCMNNLTYGDTTFGYYETIAGGAGAGPSWKGQSGIHTHCTNTRITDPEILERRYPVVLREFSLRAGSGGTGRFAGGDGVIREIEPLRPLTMSILSERRTFRPYGLAGGGDGMRGINLLVRQDGTHVNIGGRCSSCIGMYRLPCPLCFCVLLTLLRSQTSENGFVSKLQEVEATGWKPATPHEHQQK